ncbi:MAG: Dna2/Cas4 domain-containing protein [archaeon]|nr:MAG: Dna2/Cas4 domain-containing protein [archaeon]
MLKELINEFYSSKEKDKEKVAFYISDAGKCPRAVWFSLKNYPKKPITARVMRIFEHGDYTHMRIMGALFSLGLVKAVEIQIPDNEFIHGRADAIITLDNEPAILEIKSINSFKFKNTKPEKDHVLQLQLYLHYFKLKKGVLIYENKDNQELKEYVIHYDEKLVNELLTGFKGIKKHADENKPPIIPEDLEEWRCNYCVYLDSCKKIEDERGK